ncbi:MAG TPA: FtsW/RodA/SpoVE family cell cycle protein, partial [Clostridiaceae bacterium]|nr:FtsW/RodA/SpoVE family cell cycle protein [Clostridiaceae bacterium]
VITGLAFAISIIIAKFIKLDWLRSNWFRHALYLSVTALLVLVAFKGITVNGARRWLDLKIFSLQPSEAAKVGAILWLTLELEYRKKQMAQYKDKWRDPVQRFWRQGWHLLALPACKMAVWFLLIIFQPHFSAAIIFSVIVLLMFAFAGLKKSVWIAGLTELVAIFIVVVILLMLIMPLATGMSNNEFISKRFAHVFRRIDTYQNPTEASADSIRQIRQAQIALGSGGLTGVGIGRSVQKMNWLPEAHNDYVLAIIGEELGFVGTSLVLFLFMALLIFGFRIALGAKSRAGFMIAGGYTFFLVVQALINFGVAVNLLPASGISLPFFSSGGTANAFFSLAAGMVLLISKCDQKENELIQELGIGKTGRIKIVNEAGHLRDKKVAGG